MWKPVVRKLLVASDLTDGSAQALRRGRGFVEAGGVLRVVHVLPLDASVEAAATARKHVQAVLRGETGREADGESGVSIRIYRGGPAEGILDEAARFDPDLIVLGAHGEPRMRDAIFGTTASHVLREATQPVLVTQSEASRPYSKVMVAVDSESADQVLDLAFALSAPDEVHVVHAFGSGLQPLVGAGDLLEEVRTDQDVLLAGVRQRLAAAGRQPARIESIVEEGEEMDVIMRAWTRVVPDLVVMGTHGRRGFAHLLHGSLAETALLGCPSDMLIMRTGQERPGS